VLLKLRDYSGAFAAYQLYVGAGATGANRRDALKILDDLRPAQTTFLDITLANGPASIYLDSPTLGVFCLLCRSFSDFPHPIAFAELAVGPRELRSTTPPPPLQALASGPVRS
jgi:hypothetical protein